MRTVKPELPQDEQSKEKKNFQNIKDVSINLFVMISSD